MERDNVELDSSVNPEDSFILFPVEFPSSTPKRCAEKPECPGAPVKKKKPEEDAVIVERDGRLTPIKPVLPEIELMCQIVNNALSRDHSHDYNYTDENGQHHCPDLDLLTILIENLVKKYNEIH